MAVDPSIMRELITKLEEVRVEIIKNKTQKEYHRIGTLITNNSYNNILQQGFSNDP